MHRIQQKKRMTLAAKRDKIRRLREYEIKGLSKTDSMWAHDSFQYFVSAQNMLT